MEKLQIADFRLGQWQYERMDLAQPRGAVEKLENGWVDNSGIPRMRGAIGQVFGTDLHYAQGRWVWYGRLMPGLRGLVQSLTGTTGRVETINATPALATPFGNTTGGVVTGWTIVGNTIVFGRQPPSGPVLWGGSLKASASLSGVARTVGSAVVTRAAGGFTANVDVGMIFIGWTNPGSLLGWAVVKTVDSDTQLTMDRVSPTTDSGSQTFAPFAAQWALPAGVAGAVGLPGSIGGRLVFLQNNKLYFSPGPDPLTGGPRTEQWALSDVHEFPIDADGIAVQALRDRLFCFTEAGVYGVSGMAYDIVDGSGNPQHTIEEITSKSIVYGGQLGVQKWQGAMIVPCRDAIYAMDGYGAPVNLTRGLPWAEWVRDGVELGYAAVFKERYLLPVFRGGEWSTLVLGMNGVDTEQGTVFPSSKFLFSTPIAAYATTPDPDNLYAVGAQADGLLQAGGVFTSGGGIDLGGGSVADEWKFKTGPIMLGDKAVVRRVRVRYTYLDGSGESPTNLRVQVRSGDENLSGERYVEATAALHVISGSPSQWVAIDLDEPFEESSVQLVLTLEGYEVGYGPGDFVIHAIEIQYRAFGG